MLHFLGSVDEGTGIVRAAPLALATRESDFDLEAEGKLHMRRARILDHSSGSRQSDPPLLAATRRGVLAEFRRLLNSGANFDVRDERGFTPLHVAALAGRTKMLDELLERNVDVDAHDAEGRTTLNWTAEQRIPEMVEKLLAHGANPNLYPPDVLGCLNQAVVHRQHRMIKNLLGHGAESNAIDGRG
jgi:uncharacterized protein